MMVHVDHGPAGNVEKKTECWWICLLRGLFLFKRVSRNIFINKKLFTRYHKDKNAALVRVESSTVRRTGRMIRVYSTV